MSYQRRYFKCGFYFGDKISMCMWSADDALVVYAEMTKLPHLAFTTVGPCEHGMCRRHGGWRVITDAPFDMLRAALDRAIPIDDTDESPIGLDAVGVMNVFADDDDEVYA